MRIYVFSYSRELNYTYLRIYTKTYSRMDNIFGNKPVYGDDFYGRKDFIKHLVGILVSMNSFLLLGLRRTGKSSSLKQAVELIKKEHPKIIIVNLNCTTYVSIQDLYKNIYLALPETWKKKMRNFLLGTKRFPKKLIDFISDHVEEIDLEYIGSIKLRNDAISYSNPLKEELTTFFKEQKEHIVLVLDELPFLFENITNSKNEATKQEIEMILTTLRSWRDIGVSQAICGSLNLLTQLEGLGISQKLLGGVNTQKLPKFDTDAKGLLKALSKETKMTFNDDQLDEIIKLHPDCIPHFLQLFFFCLKTHWDGKTETISNIYYQYVYPAIAEDFEYQFNERFGKLEVKILTTAKKILNKVYKNPNIKESKLLQSIKDENAYLTLLILKSQEFIVMNEHNEIDFSFEIVRNWWNKKSM